MAKAEMRKVFWPLILSLIAIFLLAPLMIVVVFSFAANTVTRLPIEGLTLNWYTQLFGNSEFWSALKNSVLISLPAAIIATLTGTAVAFGLSSNDRQKALSLLSILSLPVMLPPLVIAIGLVVLFVRGLGLLLGLPAVIIGHVLLTQPLVALVIAARLATFDQTAVEAARDLGATRFQAFRFITLPQMKTAIIGAFLIAFAVSLDEFIVTLFTIGSGNTLSTFVWGRMRTALDPSINAVATLLLVFTIAVVLFSAAQNKRQA